MSSPAPTSVRLFLALWPPPEVLEALQAHAGAWSWGEAARRTRDERLHVTLHFLGDVPAAKVPDLQSGLQVPWTGCELLLDRPVVWPGGIAVLEATDVPAELAQLHARLREQLERMEVPLENRRYRPHVTLARKAFGSRPPPDLAPLRWQAGAAYDLVRSLPGGRGYETIQRFG
jgi:RNA 2',3'-cyclic 3'-phosphodiesterase